MSEIDRPEWCPDQKCKCLTSYDGAVCVGRLPQRQCHPGTKIYNTHNLCEGPEDNWQINYLDARYYLRCMQAVLGDVEDNDLYRPPDLSGEVPDFSEEGNK